MIKIDPGYRPLTIPAVPSAEAGVEVDIRDAPRVPFERRRGGDRRERGNNRAYYEMRSGRDRRRGHPRGPSINTEA